MTLAEKMEAWKEAILVAESLAEKIKAEVMELGKTQKVRGVVATFSNGRGKYDYLAAVEQAAVPVSVMSKYSTLVFDYKAICNNEGIAVDDFYTAGTPSVTLKIAEEK